MHLPTALRTMKSNRNISILYSKNFVRIVLVCVAILCVALAPLFLHALITFTVGTKITGGYSVSGSLSKGSGTFVIDDPLEPRTKLLYHSFVESPDVKNLYDGIATLDKNGEAVIKLPDYFEALNRDFRYQFFPLYEAMPNLYLKVEEKGNQFVIAGGVPGGTISWQITGNRHDAYILANPVIPEVMKSPTTPVPQGTCLYPPLCQ